jgi:HK97 family phage major capsid protein
MTLLEMRDKRGLLIDDNTSLTLKAEKENRKLTEAEQKEFDERNEKITALENAILHEEAKRKFDPASILIKKDEPKKAPSLFKAIRSIYEKGVIPSEFEEINAEGESDMRKADVGTARTAPGQIVIPATRVKEQRSVVLAGQTSGTTGGGYAIATDKPYMLPPLENALVLTAAGATYLNNLKGFVSIPTYSGTTVYWGSEVAEATNGEGTWGKVDLSPRRLVALVDVSKNFLLQEEVGAEEMLKRTLAERIAAELESEILGVGAGSLTGAPTGLFYGSSGAYYKADKTTASYEAVVNLMRNVETSNALKGSLAYITHPYGKAKLMTTAKVSTSDSVMVSDGKEVIGFPLFSTSGCAYNVFTTTGSAGLIFGNWRDLLIGQWGGYDLTVDPYTKATAGTVRLVVNCYFDAAAARSASFSVINISV